MVFDSKKEVKKVINRAFLNKDFDSMRSDLLQFARTFFSDRIQDFSEVSVGGMFLEFAAFVGDTMSFYLDHQFNELDSESAVETVNIERHLVRSGVKIIGASPAHVAMTWALEIPADPETFEPQASALPVILEGSTLESDSGVVFELTENLDYSSRFRSGELKARRTIGDRNSSGQPTSFILTMGGPGHSPAAPDGVALSGFRAEESLSISNTHIPFREIVLGNENVTQVISVRDADGNQYYEVDSLAQDTVFRGIYNLDDDNEFVAENVEIIPAPYRYVTSTNFSTKLMTIRFGSGDAATLNDDIIPDPSELALPLFGKRQFSRFSLDPAQLLGTQTLGVAPRNTVITVVYRHGGGLSHNAVSRSINTVTSLKMTFPGNPSAAVAQAVRASTSVTNINQASGGEDAPTLDELRGRIPAARNSQSRIVTKPDLLARIYTLPSSFGRVFRAGIRSNPNNPLASQLFVISRDSDKRLIIAPDTVKINLRKYLNEFRLISDAIDILDAPVINIGLEFKVTTDPEATKSIIIQDIIARLQRYFKIENFQIDQPLPLDDVQNIIFNSPGVISVVDVKFKNMHGNVMDRTYSNIKFDVNSNIRKKLLIGPPGSIFEMRYPDFDIVGSAV